MPPNMIKTLTLNEASALHSTKSSSSTTSKYKFKFDDFLYIFAQIALNETCYRDRGAADSKMTKSATGNHISPASKLTPANDNTSATGVLLSTANPNFPRGARNVS